MKSTEMASYKAKILRGFSCYICSIIFIFFNKAILSSHHWTGIFKNSYGLLPY